MKRLKILALSAALILICGMAYAGSSRILYADQTGSPDIRFRIYAEGDSIANLTLSNSTYPINGLYVYSVITIPSTPDAAYDVAIQDPDSFVLCDATGRDTSAKQSFDCSDTNGKFEKIHGNATVVIDDLGAGSTIIIIDMVK